MKNRIKILYDKNFFIHIYLCFVFYSFSITNGYSQSFSETNKLVASDRFAYDNFGSSVVINGNIAVIGSPLDDQDSEGLNWISAAGSAYIFEKDINNNWIQTQKITPSTRGSNYMFGKSISISNNQIIVSAYLENVNGVTNCGAVYVFKKDIDGIWKEQQKLIASDGSASDYFGYAITTSNNYIAIGAYNAYVNGNIYAGAVYIYHQNEDGTWSEAQKISASDCSANDYFGYSVSIDNDYILVGAQGEEHDTNGENPLYFAGSAYIFELDKVSGTWIEYQKIVPTDRGDSDCFGTSVSISGEYAMIGAYKEDEDPTLSNTLNDAGSVYFFHHENSGEWIQIQKAVASDRSETDLFGYSVSLCNNFAVVGSYNEDEDSFGTNTLSNSGSAYCFKLNDSGTWDQFQKIKASDYNIDDCFGYSVSISGNNILVGAYNEDDDASGTDTRSEAGSAYAFNLSDSYTVFASSNSGGSITPSGYYTLINNESITYNITPEDNYLIKEVLINNVSVPVIQSSITMSNLTSDNTIEVIFDIASSIGHSLYTVEDEIKISPNPAIDNIKLESSSLNLPNNLMIQIINLQGQIVKIAKLNKENSYSCTISDIPKGTYILKTDDFKPMKFIKL